MLGYAPSYQLHDQLPQILPEKSLKIVWMKGLVDGANIKMLTDTIHRSHFPVPFQTLIFLNNRAHLTIIGVDESEIF